MRSLLPLLPLQLLLLLLLAPCALVARADKPKPHIVVLLADDFGHANIGYHRPDASKEVATPNLDALAASGVKLERFYAYKICSPSRCSLQTGRLPVHVNTVNLAPITHNAHDAVSGFAGIPVNMTTLATRMKSAGYKTVMTGKWDAGMATQRHTPLGRGYDRFLGYFHHANDYWTQGVPVTAVGEVDVCLNRFLDLWLDDGPAKHLVGTAYEEVLFAAHSMDAIKSHDVQAGPLFLFHSFHLVHSPLQVPRDTLELFNFIDYANRQKYAAMVYYMDTVVGQLVGALKDRQMWDNTLLLFFSDNGGPLYDPGSGNNWPLRGGKYADFEGGVRVNALAAGGLVPQGRRGKTVDGLIHVADVYATVVGLAHGGSPGNLAELIRDDEAARANLPPVDSMDFWPLVTGSAKPDSWRPRTEVHLSAQALISGRYKLIVGTQPMNLWTGPYYPNSTGAQPVFPDVDVSGRWNFDCGPAGCLFDIFADETEHVDVANDLPELRLAMLKRLRELNLGEFKPDRGKPDSAACKVAQRTWGGFYGPFLGGKPKKRWEGGGAAGGVVDDAEVDVAAAAKMW
jgi:arylsulfatase B